MVNLPYAHLSVGMNFFRCGFKEFFNLVLVH